MSQLQPGTTCPGPRPATPFLESVIRFLLPFFLGTGMDAEAARADISDTLDAYATRTRAELLRAARVIAFSMATLDTLSEAQAADLPPALKLRYRSCAASLNRATAQTEKALEQSLARDTPAKAATATALAAPITETPPDPVDDIPDADTRATIGHAAAAIQAHRDRMAGRPQQAGPHRQERTQQLWASAMHETLQQMDRSNSSAPGSQAGAAGAATQD